MIEIFVLSCLILFSATFSLTNLFDIFFITYILFPNFLCYV